jgi:transketolase
LGRGSDTTFTHFQPQARILAGAFSPLRRELPLVGWTHQFAGSPSLQDAHMSDLAYIAKDELDRLLCLRTTPEKQVEIFAAACRLNTLYMIARAGSGHIGSSFSSLDIVATLYLEILQGVDGRLKKTHDLFISSKGHDAPGKYAVLLGLGLLDFDLIHQLRRLGGLPGHPDVATPHMYTNTGSLGMGISKARGMALARRRIGQPGHLFVMTGDGELQEGQFWESLQPTANLGLGEITVLVDHNRIQSDTWVSRVSDLGDLARKVAAFGWEVHRCDGHDIHQLLAVLPPKTGSPRPRFVICDTIKGRGVSFMEHTAMSPRERLYRYHSGAPSVEDYDRALAELRDRINGLLKAIGVGEVKLTTFPRIPSRPPEGVQRLIPAYSEALVAEGEHNPRLVVLDADLVKDTGCLSFEEKFPDRFYECGIAEQDMVSQAGGMALAGFLPFVHSFACFLSDRPNEQIYNNATELTKIIYVGSLAGLLPAGPGHSHQCVRDIAALMGVPNLVMLEPCCECETRLAVEFACRGTPESVYLRLVSIPCRVPFSLPSDYRLRLGQGVVLRDGKDVVLIGAGPILLAEAWKAADLLEQQGLEARVVNFPWLNRVDSEWLHDCVAGFPAVLTLDNHYAAGGQGQFLLAELAKMDGLHGQRRMSVGITEIPRCGLNDEVLRAHELDAWSLVERVQQLLAAPVNTLRASA